MEGLCVDGQIILKLILKTWVGRTWTRLMCLRVERVAGSCECGYGHFGSVTMRRIFWLADELVILLRAYLHGVIKQYNAHLHTAVRHIQTSATNSLSGLTALC